MPLADYHTHTPLCRHAEGWPTEYVRVAKTLGLAEIGISDHNPMPAPFDEWRMDFEEFPRYLEQVASAAEEHAPFPVRLGLEVDFLTGGEAWVEKTASLAEWDYLIGSVHYLAPGWDVDNPKWIGRFQDRPVAEIWDLYFAQFTACIRSGFFDFVAHPDLVKKFGHRPSGDLRSYYEPVIQALVDTGTAMEISTAGLHKPVGEIYPAPEMLIMAAKAGVRVVISSDAHAPREVGRDFDTAASLARECGFLETQRFEKRRATSHPL